MVATQNPKETQHKRSRSEGDTAQTLKERVLHRRVTNHPQAAAAPADPLYRRETRARAPGRHPETCRAAVRRREASASRSETSPRASAALARILLSRPAAPRSPPQARGGRLPGGPPPGVVTVG